MDLKKLETMAALQGDEIGDYVKEAFRWLHDPTIYENLVPPSFHPRRCLEWLPPPGRPS
jgi:hypothetical protein